MPLDPRSRLSPHESPQGNQPPDVRSPLKWAALPPPACSSNSWSLDVLWGGSCVDAIRSNGEWRGHALSTEGLGRHSRSFGEIPRFRREGTTPLNVTSKFQVLGMTKGLTYPHSRGVIREDANSVSVSFGFILGGIVFTKRKQNILVNTKGGSMSRRFGVCCWYMQQKVNWRRRAYRAYSAWS